MINNGFRLKDNLWGFFLSNADILRQCGTEEFKDFIRQLQRNYLAHIVHQEDDSVCKRLTFNDDQRKPQRYTTAQTMVLGHAKMDSDKFKREAM